MRRILFVGIAALTVISTAAEALDGRAAQICAAKIQANRVFSHEGPMISGG